MAYFRFLWRYYGLRARERWLTARLKALVRTEGGSIRVSIDPNLNSDPDAIARAQELGSRLYDTYLRAEVLCTRRLMATADRLHVERPMWPVIVDGRLSEQSQDKWSYDRGTNQSYLNNRGIREVRASIRAEKMARYELRTKTWGVPAAIIAVVGGLLALWARLG